MSIRLADVFDPAFSRLLELGGTSPGLVWWKTALAALGCGCCWGLGI